MNQTESAMIRLHFSEKMRGFLARDASSYEEGYRIGKELGHGFMFRLNIHTSDLDRFLKEPSHKALASGQVHSDLVGGECSLSSGSFNLFVTNPDTGLKEMHYWLHFRDAQGEPFTLHGIKIIHGWPLSRILKDSTTLYTALHRTHIPAGIAVQGSPFAIGILHIGLWGTVRPIGILHIGLWGTVRLMLSIRAKAPTLLERIRAVWRFGCFFVGTLWNS